VSTPQATPIATLLPTFVPDATVFASPLPTPTIAPTPITTPEPITTTVAVSTTALIDARGGQVATAGTTAPDVWELVYDRPQASLYNGSIAQRIPLKVQAGRGGLQPSLALSYNSGRLNGRTGSSTVERGPIGDNWTLDGGIKITRDRWFHCKTGSEPYYGQCFQDVFTLIVESTGYELEPAVPGQVRGRYYAKDGPGIYVERRNGCLVYSTNSGTCTTPDPAGGDAPNTTGEYWYVRLANGTEVRLGYTPDSEQVLSGVCYPYGTSHTVCKVDGGANDNKGVTLGYRGRYSPAPWDPEGQEYITRAARSWSVDTMTDTLGNTMVFTYSNLIGWRGWARAASRYAGFSTTIRRL